MKRFLSLRTVNCLATCLIILASTGANADDAPNFAIPPACGDKASGAGLDNPTDILPPQVTAYSINTVTEPPSITFLTITDVYQTPSSSNTWTANIYTDVPGKFVIDVGYTPILNFFTETEAKGPGINAYSLPGTYIKPAGSLLFKEFVVQIFQSDGVTAIPDAAVQFHSGVLVGSDEATSNLITLVADETGTVALDCFLFLEGSNWVTVYDSNFDYLFDTPVTRTQLAPAKFAIIDPGMGDQE